MADLPSFKEWRSLAILLIFLASNFFMLFMGISWRSLSDHSASKFPADFRQDFALASFIATLSSRLNLTQAELHLTRHELVQLKQALQASQKLSNTLLTEATKCLRSSTSLNLQENLSVGQDLTYLGANLADLEAQGGELREFTRAHTLPLGWNAGTTASNMVSPIGHACGSETNHINLAKFMHYDIGGICPDDQALVQTLMVHGCEPLPRRRCFARGPPFFREPLPLPHSLWSIPPDDSILWSSYICKSFECLNGRKRRKVFDDCVDCFDLEGREKNRWTVSHNELDFSVDEVLLLKPGTIRIGLDIGGGTGTFAVRMKERNVTIVTTSLNLNGPFNNFMALRGVVPLFLTIAQRLPFFDNTLDMVHTMHVLSRWLPIRIFEFLLFDIDRILRPGGLLWLDHFFCVEDQLDAIYTPLIEKLGYQKLRWNVGAKLDRGPELKEIYLSAVLEKPLFRT